MIDDPLIAIAFFVVWNVAAGLFIGGFLWWLRRNINAASETREDQSPKREGPDSLDWSLGLFERFVATAITVWAPLALIPFVGAWIALKLAANWQARNREKDEKLLGKHRLVGVLGNGLSFAFAITAGLILHPNSLKVWQAQPIEASDRTRAT